MFDGDQIVTVFTTIALRPVSSLKQLRREQQKSIAYRRSNNFNVCPSWYDYRRIVIEEQA